jgi:WD40 repeat protein
MHLKSPSANKAHRFYFIDNSSSGELLNTTGVLNSASTFLSLTDELFIIGFDDTPAIDIWNWKTKAQIRKLLGHPNRVKVLVKFNDNITVASGSSDGTIRIWNSTIGHSLRNVSAHLFSIRDMAYISSDQLASCSLDVSIRVWNTTSGQMLRSFRVIAFSMLSLQLVKEDCLAVGSGDKTISLWNLTTGKRIKSIYQNNEGIQCILLLNNASSSASPRLASGEFDGNVNIWHLETSQLVGNLQGHLTKVSALLNLKENHLASASEDCAINIWNYQTGQLCKTLKGHVMAISGLLLLSDGNLASCSKDKTVKIWNLPAIYKYPNRANLIASVDD